MSHIGKLTRRNALKKGGSLIALGGVAACGGGGEQATDGGSNAIVLEAEAGPVAATAEVNDLALRQAQSVRVSPSAFVSAESKYRFQQNRLFQSLPASVIPSRIPGGSPFPRELRGPTSEYVDLGVGWTWRNAGGDWIDAFSTPQGNQPWFSIATNAVSGSAAKFDYAVNVTLALRFVQTGKRWCAFLLRSGGAPRVVAGLHQLPQQPYPVPRITVKYTNGSSRTLRCLLIGGISSGARLPLTTAKKYGLPIVIEFERPAFPVASAKIGRAHV